MTMNRALTVVLLLTFLLPVASIAQVSDPEWEFRRVEAERNAEALREFHRLTSVDAVAEHERAWREAQRIAEEKKEQNRSEFIAAAKELSALVQSLNKQLEGITPRYEISDRLVNELKTIEKLAKRIHSRGKRLPRRK